MISGTYDGVEDRRKPNQGDVKRRSSYREAEQSVKTMPTEIPEEIADSGAVAVEDSIPLPEPVDFWDLLAEVQPGWYEMRPVKKR